MYNQIKSIFSSYIVYDNNKVPPIENIVKYISEKNDTLPYETINDIAYTTEEAISDMNITEDEMRDMIRNFRNSPKSYAIRLERFREIKNTLVGLMLAKVPYTKKMG